MGIHVGTYRSFLKPEKDPTEDEATATHKISADKSITTGMEKFMIKENITFGFKLRDMSKYFAKRVCYTTI